MTPQGALGKAMLSCSKTRQSKYVEVNYRIELVALTCKSRRLCYTEKTQETPKHLEPVRQHAHNAPSHPSLILPSSQNEEYFPGEMSL